MSAPIRVKVEAGIEADNATQDLWRLAEAGIETLPETDDTEQLELILARGADINARDGNGVTALVRAAYNGRIQLVRALIDHGADIDARREDGFTPLGLAAFFGHTDVVRVLVESGADLTKATRLGTSAEMWATARSFSEIARYLEQARGSADESSAHQSSANLFRVVTTPVENEPADEVYTAEPVRAEPTPSLPENELAGEVPTAEFIRATQPTPSLTDKEPAIEVPAAEPIRAAQLTPVDLEFTIETPRSMFSNQLASQHPVENPEAGQNSEHASDEPLVVAPDQLISQRLEENPATEQENKHALAKPSVVRTLKAPPEIWDLVHESRGDFHPGGTFVARLTSSNANLVLLALAVMLISGLCTLGVMTLRDRKRGGAAARLQGGAAARLPEESSSSQTASASQGNAPAGALNAPLNSQLPISASAGEGVSTTPPQATNPQTTEPQPPNPQPMAQPDNPASSSNATTASSQPIGVRVNNFLTQTASRADTFRTSAALSRNKRVTTASGRQNADKSSPARGESETAAGPNPSAKPQTSQAPQTAGLNQRSTADVKASGEKSSINSASAKKKSNTTLSPQLIAPPGTSSAPKAKVIQWP